MKNVNIIISDYHQQYYLELAASPVPLRPVPRHRIDGGRPLHRGVAGPRLDTVQYTYTTVQYSTVQYSTDWVAPHFCP